MRLVVMLVRIVCEIVRPVNRDKNSAHLLAISPFVQPFSLVSQLRLPFSIYITYSLLFSPVQLLSSSLFYPVSLCKSELQSLLFHPVYRLALYFLPVTCNTCKHLLFYILSWGRHTSLCFGWYIFIDFHFLYSLPFIN